MNVQNFGDILHIIILTLILVWLFYHQWLLTKVMDLLRQMADKLPGTGKTCTKEEDMNNNRKDSDFQLKR